MAGTFIELSLDSWKVSLEFRDWLAFKVYTVDVWRGADEGQPLGLSFAAKLLGVAHVVLYTLSLDFWSEELGRKLALPEVLCVRVVLVVFEASVGA